VVQTRFHEAPKHSDEADWLVEFSWDWRDTQAAAFLEQASAYRSRNMDGFLLGASDMNKPQSDEERRDGILKRMLNTPHTPQSLALSKRDTPEDDSHVS
jgi:hypothetical protein